MRTDDFRPSDNVEDNREARGGIPGGAGGLGIGTIVIVGLISWYFGIDPSVLLNGAQILNGGTQQQGGGSAPPVDSGIPNDASGKFVAAVLLARALPHGEAAGPVADFEEVQLAGLAAQHDAAGGAMMDRLIANDRALQARDEFVDDFSVVELQFL